jgi:hypothetical protein
MIKVVSDINLHKNSLRLSKEGENENDETYHLQFSFDTRYDCIITIYFCTTEARDAYNYPIYFMTPKHLPAPNSYKFANGTQQEFPTKVANIDASLYKIKDLLNFREDYYPLIISMVRCNLTLRNL